MYYIKAESSFDSAHFLKGYKGKCSNLHGHRWRVVVCIKSETLCEDIQNRGMVTDFGDIKKSLKKMCDELDHCFIYEKDSLKEKTIEALNDEDFRLVEVDFRPTAENFARFFFDELLKEGYDMESTQVYETPNNSALYKA